MIDLKKIARAALAQRESTASVKRCEGLVRDEYRATRCRRSSVVEQRFRKAEGGRSKDDGIRQASEGG